MRAVFPFAFFALLALGCGARKKESNSGSAPSVHAPPGFEVPREPVEPTLGFEMWRDRVQPALSEACSDCHLGVRFNTASLQRQGETFSEEETLANYETFVDMISADNPRHSRLLAKIVSPSEPEAIHHGGNSERVSKTDPLYLTLLEWIELEQAIRCPDCGSDAKKAYVAYVEQPAVNWMIEREPTREDRGIRRGAKIMMQPIDPGSLALLGTPIDFLGDSFCPDGDECDYGHLAASHDGKMLAFECRVAVDGEPWIERTWNMCIADIKSDGTASHPRFLKDKEDLFVGHTQTRTTPFGILDNNGGKSFVSPFNKHFLLRKRTDQHPAFSPDDKRLYFSTQAPDPRSGDDMVETYHGTFHLKHLVSSALDGSDVQTVIRNDGGTVDFPFFRKNGNVAAHVWNLERMDRHLYSQATADGLMEMPVLLGHLQGPNNWGKAFEMVNGLIVGMTGRRRGEMENYVPFFADHTVGIQGLDPELEGFQGFQIIDTKYLEEIGDYPSGYCPGNVDAKTAETTPNCSISKLVLDANWTPHNLALVSYNPEKTYIGMGESFALTYAPGVTVQERQAAAEPYLPKKMGIGLYELNGNVRTLIPNKPGTFSSFPVWVGQRQRPRVQPRVTDEKVDWAELHVADVPMWFTFAMNTNGAGDKRARYELTQQTVALRILRKVSDSNSCISDAQYIQMSNRPSNGLHPTVLGLVDSTGWEQFLVPQDAGGNAYGDVPLKADRSLRVRVPAGQLLWMVGVDADGNMTAHRQRVSALPPGHRVNAGVKTDQYDAQCARCHGSFQTPMAQTRDLRNLSPIMDFDTVAAVEPIVDLTGDGVNTRLLTYRDVLRPLFDENCMTGCHTGENAAGQLSLDAAYSPTGNAPKGSWQDVAWEEYVTFLNAQEGATVTPSYNYTPTYSFVFRSDQANYKTFYASEMSSHKTLGNLTPWDPGYQNLFMKQHYVNGSGHITSMGRVPQEGGNARHSYLLEVLGGKDRDPNHQFSGMDHTGILSDGELRTLAAVLDAGMPYTARCSDLIAPEGPNQGAPWGEPASSDVR